MSFLERIVEARRRDMALATQPDEGRRPPAAQRHASHRFRAALQRPGINIIGEFKRASPSLGPIRLDADLAQTVRVYQRAGAAAISILTEPTFFRGSLDDLRQARAATDLPILRKDFIVAERQLDEVAVAGADAVLLIVAALSDEELRRFRVRAEDDLGLDALVEVHTADEMKRAADCGAKLIGVNNRDLRTFTTSLATSERLAALASPDAILVTESGISSRDDVVRLARCGYRGFLVGESLMRTDDPAALVRELRGVEAEQPQIKVCGITNTMDARQCGKLGVQMIGLNFSPQSARCIPAGEAKRIIDAVRAEFPALKFVGVFVDQALAFVQQTARELRLDGIQLHGDEPPDYARELRGRFIVKALRVADGFSAETAAAYDCSAVLLDTYSAAAPGGTGEQFDWSVAAEVKSRVERLVLAGGLRPENVRQAIERVQPFAVDVCSGVEDAPGRKNPEKLRRFVGAVRGDALP